MAAIFHLRRIGPEATRPESSRVICFTRTLTMIGRSAAQVDYVICSADFRQNAIVSRRHCRVRRQGAILLMLDDSRNGVYINDVKINGQAELYEGDTVVFGHPNGERLAAGVRVRQPDSEYQFILERCRCQRDQPQRPEPEQPDVQARVMPPPATAPNTAPAAASKPAPEPEVAPDVAAASTSSATLDQVPIKQDPPKAAMEKTDSVETATEMPQESVTDDSTVNAVESHKEVEVQPKEIEDPSKRLKDSPKELADLPNETKEPQMELEESSNSTEEPPKETESFSKATQDSNMKDDAPIEDTVENVDLPNVIDAPRVIDTSESIEGSSNQGTDLQDDEPKGVEDSTSSGDKTSLADRPESDVTEQSVEQQNATPFTSESEVVQGHNEVNSMDFGQSRTDVNTNTDDIQINQDVQMTDTSQENTTPTTSESEVVQSHEGVNPMDVGQSSIDINTNSDDNQTNPDVHLIGTPQDTVAPSENHQLDQPAENQMLQGVPVIEILPEVQDIEMLEAVQEGTADHQMSESETMNSRSAANASTVVNESPVVNSAESNESAQSEAQEAQPQPNLSEVDPMRIDQPTDVETPHNDQSAAQDHPILAPTEAVDQQPLDQSEAVDQQPLDQSAAVDQLPLYQSEVQDPPQHDQAEAPQLTEEHLRTSDIPSGTDEVCIAVPSPSTIDSRPEPVCDTAVVPFDSPQGKVVQSPYPASSGATSSKTSVCDSKVCELEGKPAAALSSEVTQNPPQPEESPEVAVESQQKPKPGSSVDEVSNVQIRSVEISREMDTFEETPKAKEVSDEPSEEASDVQKVVSSPKETISEEPIVSLLVVESVNDVEFESPELQCEEEPGSPVVPLVNSNLPSLRGQPAASDEIEVEMSKEMIQSTTPSTEVPLCPNPIEACPTATEESPKVDIVMKFQQKPELEASIVEESEERSRDFESSEEKDVLEETLPSKEQDISEKPFNLHEEKETTSMESQSEEERKSSVAKSAEPLCDPAIYDETCETEMSFASPQKTTPITSVDKESDVLSKEDGNDSYEKVPTLELDHQDVTDEQPIRHESSDNVSSVDESQSREIIKSCENEPALANNEMDVEMEPPEVLNEPGSPIVPLVESNLPLVLEELKATVQMEDTEKVNSEHVPQCDQDVVKSLEISGVGNSQEEAEADSLHETNRLAVIQESLTQTASVTVNLNENIKELKTDSNIKLTTVSEEADFAIANRVPERTVKSHESISCDNIATCRSKDKVEPVVQLGTSDDVSIQGNSETRGSLLNKNELHVQTEEGNKPNESAKVEAVETSSVILETLDHSPEAEQQSVMTADPTSEEIEVAVTADIEKDVDNEMDFESDQIETNGKVESTPENSIIENTDLNKDQNLGEQESEPKEIEQSSQKSTLTASNEVVSVSDVLPENENFEEKASNSTETTGDCLKTSANEIPIAACNEQVIAEQAIDDSVVKPPTNVNNSEENTVLEEDQQRSSDAAKICQLQLDDDKPNTNEDPIITESTPITDSVPVFDVQIETNSPIAVLSDDFLSLKSQTPVKEVNIDVVGEKNEESMQTDSENVACLTEDLSKIEHANEESEKELQRSNHQPLVVAIPNNSGDANKIMDDVAEAERVCPLEVKVDKNGPIPSLPDDFLVKNDDEGACHAKSTKGETPDQQTKETEKGNLESTFCQIEIVDLDAHNKAEHFRKECENELNILKNQPAEVVNDHLLAEENTTARKLEINIERNCAIQVLPDDVLAIAVDKNESASQQGSEPVPDDEPTEADECSKQMESTFCVEVASSLDDKVKTQHFREECEKELLSLRVQTIAQSTCPSTGEDEAFSSLQTVGKADIVEETKIEDKEVEQENSLAINVELNSPMPALPEDFLTVAQQEKNTEVLEETFIEVVASTSPEEEEKVRRFREECEKDLDHLKNQPSEADAGNSYLCPNELVETSVEEKVEASVENPSVEIDEQTATNDAPIGSLPVQNCDNTLEVKVDMNSPIPALPDDFLSLKNSEVKCEKDPELETTFACDVLATSPEAKEMIKQHREKWKQDLENLEKQPLNFESNLEVEEILRKVKTRGNDIETGHAKELKVAIKAESKESQEKDGPTMKIHDLPKSSTPSASPVITDLTEDIPMVSPVISEDEMVKLPMSPVPSTSRNILSNLSPSVARHSKKRVQLCLSPIRSPVSRTSYPVSPLTSSAKKFPVKSFTPMPSKLSRQMTLDDSPMSSPTSKKLRPHLFISPGPSANKKRLRNSDEQSPSKRTRFDVPLFLATGMGSACSSPGVLPRLASLVASPASGSSPSSYIHSLLSQKLVSESDDEDIEEHQFSDAEENDPNCSDVQKEPSSDDSSVLPENKLDQSVAKEPAMSHESCRQSREISTQTSEADPDTYSIVSAKVADNTSTCTPNILVDRPSRESQSLVIDSEPRDCGALKSQNMNDSETVAEQPQDTVVLPLQPQKACQQSVAQNDTHDVGLDLSEKKTGPTTDTPINVPVDAVQAGLPLNEDPVSENKTTSEVVPDKPQSPVMNHASERDDLEQNDVCEPLVNEAGCSMDEDPTKTDETGPSLLLHESEEQTAEAEGVLAAEDEKIESDVLESGSKMDDLSSQPLMTQDSLVMNEDDPCVSKQKILKRKRGSDDEELKDDNKKANRQQSDSAEVVEMPSANQDGIYPNDVQKSCEQSQKENPSEAEHHSINVLSSDSDCEFAMEGVTWIDDDRMPEDTEKKIESKENPISSKSPMVVSSDVDNIIDKPHEDAFEDNDDQRTEHSGHEIPIDALKADVPEQADVVTPKLGDEKAENDALYTDDEERHSMQLPDSVDSERINKTNQENDVTAAANHTQSMNMEDREENGTKDIPTVEETSMKIDVDQTKIVKEDDFSNSTKNPSVEESSEIPDQDAALNDTEILEDEDVGMRRENSSASTVTDNVSMNSVTVYVDSDNAKNNSEQMDTNMVTSEHKEQLGNEDEKSLPIDKTNEENGGEATANDTQNINTEESMENLQGGIEGLQSSVLQDTEERSEKAIPTIEETSMNVTITDVSQTETVKENDVSKSTKNTIVEGSSEVPDQDAALNDTEILEDEDVGMRRENLLVPENVSMIPVTVLVDGDQSKNNSEQMDTNMVTSEDKAQMSNSEDERSLPTDNVEATANCTQSGIEQSSLTRDGENNSKNTIPTEEEISKKVVEAEVKHTETVEEEDDVSNSTKNVVVHGNSGQNDALDDTVILEDEDVEIKRTKLPVSTVTENASIYPITPLVDTDDAKNNSEQMVINMVTSEHNEQISNEDEKSLPIDSTNEENGEETTENCSQNTNMEESLENHQGGIEQSSQMQDSENIGMEPIQTVEEMSMNVSKADVKRTETVKEDFPNSNKNTIEEENSEVPDQDTAFDNTEILEEDADMNRMKSSDSSVTENVLVNPINPVLEDLEDDFFEKLDEDIEENLAPSEPVKPDNAIYEALDKEEKENELIVISTDDTDLDEPETSPADKAELVKEVLKLLIASESQDDEETQDVGGNENLESVDVHHSLGKMQDVELKRLGQSDYKVSLSTSDEDGSFKKLETIRKSKRRTPLKSVAKIQAGTYSTLTQERGLAPTQVFPQGLDVAPRAEKISCSLERPTQIAPVFETIPASAADVTTVLEPTQLLTPLKKPDTLPKESGGNSSEMFLDTDNDSDSLPAVDKIISALEEASDSESKKAEDPLDSTIVITDSSDDEITPYQRCMGEELVGLKKEAPEGAKNSSSSLEMIADSQDSDFELSQMIPIHSSGTKSAGFTQIKPAAFPGDSEETDVMSEDVSPQVSFPRKRKILMKTPEKTKRRISSCDTTECDDSETDKENGPSAHNTPTRSKRCLSLKKRRRTALGFTQSEGHTTEQQARVDTSPHVSDPVIGRVEVTSAEGSQGDVAADPGPIVRSASPEFDDLPTTAGEDDDNDDDDVEDFNDIYRRDQSYNMNDDDDNIDEDGDDNIDEDGDEIMDFPELDSPADFMESDHVQYTEEGEQDSPCLSNPDIFDDSSAYKTAQEAATVEITESTDSVPVSEDTLQITGATITADDDEPLPGPSYTEPKKDNSISGVLARIRERKRSLLTPKPDPDAASPETSPAVTPGGSQGPSGSQETPGGIPGTTAARRAILPEGGEMDIATADDVSKRSKDILNNLSTLMSSRPQLNAHARVQSWQADVAKLKNKLLMPHTIIAVVGDTGSGKSSLMNALLDHADILPTSGMRACTAVVVEITNNRLNGNYEADIEFLSAKEWDDELNFLLSELTDREGNLRHRQPDPKSEGGVAWSKIRAVYGAFPEGVTKAGLVRQNVNVTRWLGNVKRISEPNPKRFRRLIDHYIESTENGAGGDYWPIVKHVKVRIPNCEVCRSGATLVDLPGIRDSNAARDKIAKDFLRNCTAVWVVASIHRAVDDKTAKDLLGEHFRRQLLMDGQYGSVCFICTKTDVIVPSEIIRGLKLEDTVAPLEQEITALETSAVDLLAELERLRAEMDDLDEALEEMEGECRGIEDSMTQPEVTEDESVSRHLSETLVENRQTLTDVRGRIKDLRRQKRDVNQKLTENTSRADGLQRQITALCAKARNDYSKNQIRRDFRAGLKEMKRQAGLSEEDLEEDDGEDDDDEERAGEDTDLQRTVDNLSVFCVSALEYLKLRRKLSKEDGEAQVFADTSDTGIPSLQQFVDDLTRQRRAEGTKRLVSCIGQTVIDVHHYLTDEGTKDHSIRGSAKSIYVQLLEGLKAECVSRIIGDSSERIDALFNTSLRPKAEEGVQAAVGSACDTVTKWGSKVNRDKPAEGGLYWATYKATVKRDGVYKSPTRGPIDFNEDLAGPMYASITIVWDRIFNSYLNNILENAKRSLLDSLSRFGDQMVSQLTFLGVQTDRVQRTRQQQITSASNKLAETIRGLKELIQEKQREVSRVITPSVQNSMRSAYTVCVQESGSGQFNRMRGHMIGHVNRDRVLIFDRASEQLLNNLLQLQNTIVAELRVVCDRVVQDLTAVYEPLWEAPDNTKVLRDNYLTGVMAVCLEIAALYRQLQLTAQPEFAVLDRPHVPVAATTPAATVVTAATQPANMVNMATPPPAAMHVTVGTTPASPQVSNQLLMQIQALHAKQQNAGGVQTVYLPIGAKSGQQYPLLQRQPFSLLQQNSPVVVTTGKASKKKGKVSATMTSAQAAVANQHSLLLAQQIARSVVGQATPNAPIRVRLPTSVVQNLPTVQAQNVHQSQAGMVSLLQTTGVRVAGPRATSTVTSGPGQPGVTMVKREPKSPKKKRPVNYGNAVIDLCEDDDPQSDIPTMKKKKKR